LFDANRQLPQPWDYNAVLVIAPQGAAGLGDFQGEAQRLERFGIGSFTYAHSRFQGEGAAAEIRGVLLAVLDITQTTRRAVDQADAAVRGGALRHLALASEHSTRMLADVRLDALKAGRDASDRSHESFFEVRDQVLSQLSEVRQSVPALLAEVRSEARLSIRSARVQSDTELGAMLERTAWGTRQARDVIETALRDVAAASRRITSDVINGSEALMREIAGQGPEKTLGRGFAVVRKTDGTTLTSARDTAGKVSIEVQFHDGKVAARTADEQGSERQ
jgi:exodeoxyribonuclease VII large subunit